MSPRRASDSIKLSATSAVTSWLRALPLAAALVLGCGPAGSNGPGAASGTGSQGEPSGTASGTASDPASGMASATVSASRLHMLGSEYVDQQEFRISVALPFGYDPDQGTRYPVLYVLDADLVFGSSAEITRGLTLGQELPPLIVVGVGYPVESFVATLGIRARDLTPTDDPVWLEESLADAALAGMPPPAGAGGGPAFLRFLTEELIPFIDAEYRTLPGDRGLFGDSLGGLFALYALFHQPDAFRRYIVGSPSLWWDSEVSFRFVEDFVGSREDVVARVYMGVGELEEVGAELTPFRMVSNVERMEEVLSGAGFPGLHLETKVFEGETHMSVPPMVFSRGVRSVYPIAAAAPVR